MSTVSTETFMTAIKAIMVDNAMATFMRHAQPGPEVDLTAVRDELTRRVEERTDELIALLHTYPAGDRDEAQVLLDAARVLEESITKAQAALREPETLKNSTHQAARSAADKLVGELTAVRRLRSLAHEKSRAAVSAA